MADNTQDREALIREIAEQVHALGGDFTEKQAEQVRTIVREENEANVGRGYTRAPEVDPESDDALKHTIYGRLGMTVADVEMAHDVLVAGQTRGGKPPSEQMRNIVSAARKARAMDTAESGYGSQLVADAIYVPQIWEVARQEYSRIGGLIESRTMQGPVEKHPILTTIPDMIYVGETADNIAAATAYGTQKVGSQEVTLTAKKFVTHYNFSGEMVEDAVVPFVPLLKTAAAVAQGMLMDKLSLNGDTTNAGTGNLNLDDADPADTLYYLAADGIRKAGLLDNTNNCSNAGGPVTYEDLLYLPTLMIDRTYDQHWGRPASPNDLVYVGTPELDNDILGLSEVQEAANARGMVGQNFAPLNGELIRIAGSPYISTIAMPLTMADGKSNATGNTLGQIVCFNPRGYLWGVKRSVTFETERYARYDAWSIVMSTRVGFARYTPTGAASGIESAAVLYNITNS